MRILLIDTCTERGIIAYGDASNLIFARELPFGSAQSKYLMPWIEEEFKAYGWPPPLDLIGVGIGPGSYTGIRLGVSAAQALAYAWKVPLVGVSSFDGFIPSKRGVAYAAIMDARIAGAYVQKGKLDEEGKQSRENPLVVSIDEVGAILNDVRYLVTPNSKGLPKKLCEKYPEAQWDWEEKGPSAEYLMRSIEENYREGKHLATPPQHLELLYLRETEAERAAKARSRIN